MNRRLAGVTACFAVLMAAAPFALNAYWVDVLNSVGLYALLALSLNVILGEAGLFNMGHAAFYAVGAYTAAILNTRYQVPILWALPVAGRSRGPHSGWKLAAFSSETAWSMSFFMKAANSCGPR